MTLYDTWSLRWLENKEFRKVFVVVLYAFTVVHQAQRPILEGWFRKEVLTGNKVKIFDEVRGDYPPLDFMAKLLTKRGGGELPLTEDGAEFYAQLKDASSPLLQLFKVLGLTPKKIDELLSLITAEIPEVRDMLTIEELALNIFNERNLKKNLKTVLDRYEV